MIWANIHLNISIMKTPWIKWGKSIQNGGRGLKPRGEEKEWKWENMLIWSDLRWNARGALGLGGPSRITELIFLVPHLKFLSYLVHKMAINLIKINFSIQLILPTITHSNLAWGAYLVKFLGQKQVSKNWHF